MDNRTKLKNEREQIQLEEKRKSDIKQCKHYGFEENTSDFYNCLMQIDFKRKELVKKEKILRCENVRRDNSSSGVTGFWGGVLMGMRENLACD